MEIDIADILELRDTGQFLKLMQLMFEERIETNAFFRLTATPSDLGAVSAALADSNLRELLEHPPGRENGWTVKPLPPLRRNALGFENDRINFHHMKFIRNGHLEFWTAIDTNFCWLQNEDSFKKQPRLYPYPVVEYPVSFCRLYSQLCALLQLESNVIFQMQYLNVLGTTLLPYRPDSIGFMAPMNPVIPLKKARLVLPKKTIPVPFDPDTVALQIIEDLYYEFGYGREHIPFFDKTDHVTEL